MSIVDKLTYLQTTKQLLKTEINKINNVLTDESTFRSYPQELFNGYLDVLNNGTDTLWSNLEKVSASGETPVLENVETAPMKIELNGNTIQDGTPTPDTPVDIQVVTGENVVSVSGKNLLPYTYPINLGDIELCEINTYKDFPFKAINGNEYYDTLTDEQKNALNYGSWYMHKEIGKVVLDGSEKNWFQSGNYFRIRISNSKSGTNCRSNYFVAGNQDNQFFAYTDNFLGFRYGVLNNILADWKTWLSTHNTIVYYILATPTEEEITNTTLISQLEAIANAKSVKDKTYITQTNDELPFILDVEAIKEYEVV